ncbi:MAG: hypothetical protein KJ787_14015 [Gammaproteobacteria bacterium]|nr:hypothetical protein [Gammaproteobacteria bacterium]MBU1647443.1 hypothetical protein [Gammaproteobacteria bacterium]MBU1973235.1 hypothetical protein [Gammaproteobacteria bacterium]
MTPDTWHDCGLDRDGQLRIERGPWTIVRTLIAGQLRYALYRGIELQGDFPDAHEAAVHADTIEASHP